MGGFFHGVRVTEQSSGAVPIPTVRAAVIGVVGTAPSWAVESPAVAPAVGAPTLVSSGLDAANFGPLIQGYSIPYALAAIQAQGRGQAIVINVFDPTRHYTTIAPAAMSFPATGPQVINLGHMGISSTGTPGKPTVKNSGGSTTYVEGTDYTVDYYNGLIIQKPGGAITTGEAMLIGYSYNDPSKVVDADIIGAITSGVYTGLQSFQTTFLTMGFFAKILIAPGFSHNQDVAAALLAMSSTIRARALIDCPAGTSRATAVSNRGTSGNAFDTSSYRAALYAPDVQFTDNGLVPTGVTVNAVGSPVVAVAGTTSVAGLGQWAAGVWAAVIIAVGPWESPSNIPLIGPIGPDVSMYMSPYDPNSDSELLNAAGIVTVMSDFATGLRLWGNRSAAYPTYTDPAQFLSTRLMMDVVEDSIIQGMLQFVDLPLTAALIDAVIASVNAFLRGFIQLGGLIDARCSFNPAENTVTQLEAGQLTLDVQIMPPSPLEDLDFNISNNPAYLSELAASVAQVAA